MIRFEKLLVPHRPAVLWVLLLVLPTLTGSAAACAAPPPQSASVSASQTVEVSGRVVNLSGAPMEHATVTWWPARSTYEEWLVELEGEGDPLGTTQTDADGQYRLEAPRSGVQIRVDRSGHLPESSRVAPILEPTFLPSSVLVPGRLEEVQVVDTAGRPFAGARVRAWATRRERQQAWTPEPQWIQTDAEGAARVFVVPGRSTRLVARVPQLRPDGSLAGVLESIQEMRFGRRLEVEVADDTLALVVRRGGRPLPRAILSLDDGSRWQSDKAGRLEVRASLAESFLAGVLATPDDLRQWAWAGETLEGPIPIDLPRLKTLRARLVSEAGDALPGAFLPSSGWPLSHRPILTDAEGRIEIFVPETSDREVPGTVVAVGHRSRPLGLHPDRHDDDGGDDDQPIEVEMSRAATVQLRVQDPSGVPLSGVAVWLQKVENSQWKFEVRPRFQSDTVTATDSGGRATLDFLEPDVPHLAWLASPGFAPQAVEFRSPAAGKTFDAGEIRLTRGIQITGRTLSDDGHPVAGAVVRVEISRSERNASDGNRAKWLGEALAVTDAEGRFSLAGLQPGQKRVEIEADRRVGVQLDDVGVGPEPLDLGDVTLSKGISLKVRVVEIVDGRRVPMPGVSVSALGGGQTTRPRTNANGEITVVAVDPESDQPLSLFAMSGGVTGLSRWRPGQPASTFLTTRPVSVLTGRLFDANGQPVEEGKVYLRQGGGQRKPDRVVGSAFFLRVDEPGSWQVSAEAPGLRTTTPLRVEVGEAQVLGNLSVRLSPDSGQP